MGSEGKFFNEINLANGSKNEKRCHMTSFFHPGFDSLLLSKKQTDTFKVSVCFWS